MDMPTYTPVGFNFSEILAKTFIIPAIQKQLIQQKIFNKLHFVRLLLKRIQTLHSLDRTLKIHSGINNVISDKQMLTGGQPIVYSDGDDNCCLDVTIMRAMNSQDYIFLNLISKTTIY